jgi:hypothetical protein
MSTRFDNAPDGYTDADLMRDYTLAWTGRGDASHSWASGELDDIVREEPERAWSMILSLIGEARSDQFLAIIAAGPLENLLCEHGEAFIERVEQLAARDPHFRHALAGVWGWSRMPEVLQSRLRTAVGDEKL